jgi:DNA-binding GntR family transcriptional regulator
MGAHNTPTMRHAKIDWVYAAKVRRPPGDSWEEHAEIVDAIEKGDATLARQAAQTHIQRAVARRS